ncbi:MAG: ribonuclease D [Arenicella sp.]|jgi:ribonuclease D
MKRLSKEQIRELPLFAGLNKSDIYVIDNDIDASKAILELENKTCLGFDTESKPLFQKGEFNAGPTLIQLATESKAFLFPVRFPCALAAAKKILIDPSIEKVGFGTNHDKKELGEKLKIPIKNVHNLSSTLRSLVDDGKPVGARAAVALILNSRLTKGAQKSNWGRYPLTRSQVQYAANDAYSALCVRNSVTNLDRRKDSEEKS